jgi:hypothetical protein
MRRGYQDQPPPRRMISFTSGGGATEYNLEPRYAVRSPELRFKFRLRRRRSHKIKDGGDLKSEVCKHEQLGFVMSMNFTS